jgi:hypothetical protein
VNKPIYCPSCSYGPIEIDEEEEEVAEPEAEEVTELEAPAPDEKEEVTEAEPEKEEEPAEEEEEEELAEEEEDESDGTDALQRVDPGAEEGAEREASGAEASGPILIAIAPDQSEQSQQRSRTYKFARGKKRS